MHRIIIVDRERVCCQPHSQSTRAYKRRQGFTTAAKQRRSDRVNTTFTTWRSRQGEGSAVRHDALSHSAVSHFRGVYSSNRTPQTCLMQVCCHLFTRCAGTEREALVIIWVVVSNVAGVMLDKYLFPSPAIFIKI